MSDRNARVWTGSAWVSISAPVSTSNAVAVWQSTAPSSPVTGQIWIDSDDNRMYVWSGSAWIAVALDLSAYATLASPIFTGTVVLPTNTSVGNVSSTEIGFLDGVTSAIQTQLNNKENFIPLQSTAPTSPATSDMWVDNTVPAAPVLKIYNGSTWITVAGGGGAADDDQIILASRVFA